MVATCQAKETKLRTRGMGIFIKNLSRKCWGHAAYALCKISSCL